MTEQNIIEIITILITLVLGFIAKKNPKFNNKRIPVQNLLIGIASFVVNYIITKDINGSLIFSGLLAGGAYDLFKNFKDLDVIPKDLDESILESEVSDDE